jgi:hypothetical protein
VEPASGRTPLAAIAALVTLTLIGVNAKPQHGDDALDELWGFRERIGTYATLHRDLASRLPNLGPFDDSSVYLALQTSLASEIKAARSTAGLGDIFTPDVAAVLRQRIGDALCGRDTAGMFEDLDEEPSAVDRNRLHVHDRYPAWARHDVPVILLQRLPILPEGIFYRFVNDDLVLWDADADLIVDVLPDAISIAIATPGRCRRARLSGHSGDELLARLEKSP